MSKKNLLAFLIALSMLVLPFQTRGIPLELGLGIDGSSSISSSEFDLQKNAYISVLQDPNIIPRDGSIAIGISQFASSVQQMFPVTIIDDMSIIGLIDSLTNMTQLGGLTNISGSIDALANEILVNMIDSDRQVIDISTDGNQTVAGDPLASGNAAVGGRYRSSKLPGRWLECQLQLHSRAGFL